MKRVILADVPIGGIVRVDGQWGVVCITGGSFDTRRWKVVDFWGEGRQRVSTTKVVDWKVA